MGAKRGRPPHPDATHRRGAGKGNGEVGDHSVLYFRVPDINAAYDELAERGVVFEGAPHMIFRHPDGTEEWMAFFPDPDGHLLAIMSQVNA